MSDSLKSYLHDHLAGSHFATKLLNALQEQYKDEPLGKFAGAMLAEVAQDQNILEQIIQQVGTAHLDLTESVGWLAERASQFKLHRDKAGAGLGTFEAVEVLALGIRGKLALWQALPAIRQLDARIPALDFAQLASRAEEQFARTDEERLNLIRFVFQPESQGH
jgi:hypothetical protein